MSSLRLRVGEERKASSEESWRHEACVDTLQESSAKNKAKTSPKPLKPTGPNRSKDTTVYRDISTQDPRDPREDTTSTRGELAPTFSSQHTHTRGEKTEVSHGEVESACKEPEFTRKKTENKYLKQLKRKRKRSHNERMGYSKQKSGFEKEPRQSSRSQKLFTKDQVQVKKPRKRESLSSCSLEPNGEIQQTLQQWTWCGQAHIPEHTIRDTQGREVTPMFFFKKRLVRREPNGCPWVTILWVLFLPAFYNSYFLGKFL